MATAAMSVPHAAVRDAPRVSVVLPCLNEVEAVASVVEEAQAVLRREGIRGEVIVVDNGSTDGSAEAAGSAGARVIHAARRGYGAAYHAGFAAATGDVILMADADGTYDLSAIPAFLAAIDAGSDLVMGSRWKGGIHEGAMPWIHRYVGSPVLTGLLNLFYGATVSDAHCGMRAFRRDALGSMRLRMPGMELASEMIVNAARAGLRVGEVPVAYRPRRGTSKLHSLRDGWRHLRFLLLYSPTHLYLVPGLAVLAIGLALVLALLPGPLTVGPYHLDIHFMVLGAFLALVGFQVVAIGLYAKTLAVALGLQPVDRTLRMVQRMFRLEQVLLIGGSLFFSGLFVDAGIAARWVSTGLGALDEVRPALFALTVMLIGIQLAFAALFLSTVDMQAGEAER
jgi:glycosyltransferase involved in cell wall biosynthesis